MDRREKMAHFIKQSDNGVSRKILTNKIYLAESNNIQDLHNSFFPMTRCLGKYCDDVDIILFAFFEDLVQSENTKKDFIGLKIHLQKLQFEQLEKDVRIWEKLKESRNFITRKIRVLISTFPLSSYEKEELISCFSENYSNLSKSALQLLSFVLNIKIWLICENGKVPKKFEHPGTKNPKMFFFIYDNRCESIRGILYLKESNSNVSQAKQRQVPINDYELQLKRLYEGISRSPISLDEDYLKNNSISNLLIRGEEIISSEKNTKGLLKKCEDPGCSKQVKKILTCNHLICEKCLTKAYKNGGICPKCSTKIVNQPTYEVKQLIPKQILRNSPFSESISSFVYCLACSEKKQKNAVISLKNNYFLCKDCWNLDRFHKKKKYGIPKKLNCVKCGINRCPGDFICLKEDLIVCMRCLMFSAIHQRLKTIEIDSFIIEISKEVKQVWEVKGTFELCLKCEQKGIIFFGEFICPKNHRVCIECQNKCGNACIYCNRELIAKRYRWNFSDTIRSDPEMIPQSPFN